MKLLKRAPFSESSRFLRNGALLAVVLGATWTRANDPGLPAVIARGDVVRDAFPNPPVPLYQGNGRFGSCYGPLGLHGEPGAAPKQSAFGRTQFMHVQHFVRAKFNADYLVPLARIYWGQPPSKLDRYRQHQSFFDGAIVTAFEGDGQAVSVTSWFDAVNRDLAGFIVDVEKGSPSIVLEPMKNLQGHYDQSWQQAATVKVAKAGATISLRCLDKETTLFLSTNATVEVVESGIRLALQPGRNTILLSVNTPVDTTAEKSLARTKEAWARTWTGGGWVDLPDDDAQKTWVRSMAYILSSTNDDGLGMPPPCGLSGNEWPFPFPQDLSYIHPALLSHGHLDIARSWIDQWAGDIDGMKRYTRRALEADGILMPWVYPYGSIDRYHDPDSPNIFYYQLHNSGYVARMAHETGVMLDDPAWTERNVRPLIRETAAFFKSFCKREADGYWHLFITPSVGQDERGGRNQKDYLCALYSAQYCFQKAIDYGLDTDGEYRRILDDGLAIPTLMSKHGFLYSCAGSGKQDLGDQKHLVQLNPLTFLPLYNRLPPEVQTAYKHRYDLNERAREPFFYGWTGGQILLASTRMGDVEGWREDWNSLTGGEYFDPDLITNYETSGVTGASYFVTTHGLLAQSLVDNIVSSWWGELVVGQCLPWDGPVRFGNLRSPLGVIVSGEIANGVANVQLTAWKDCTFTINGRKGSLSKGQTASLTLNLEKDALVRTTR